MTQYFEKFTHKTSAKTQYFYFTITVNRTKILIDRIPLLELCITSFKNVQRSHRDHNLVSVRLAVVKMYSTFFQ